MCLNPPVEYCDTKCFQRLPKRAEDVATPLFTRSRLDQVLADEQAAVKVQHTQPYTPQSLWYKFRRHQGAKTKRATRNTHKHTHKTL